VSDRILEADFSSSASLNIMNDFLPDMPQPLVFKFPVGSTEAAGVDLKWVGEQFKYTSELLQSFTESYNELVNLHKHPPELLRAQFKVIEALANYQISLVEQQRRRQGYIQNESELQEMMNQLEMFVKSFREGK
jgi:hypothetical protein